MSHMAQGDGNNYVMISNIGDMVMKRTYLILGVFDIRNRQYKIPTSFETLDVRYSLI